MKIQVNLGLLMLVVIGSSQASLLSSIRTPSAHANDWKPYLDMMLKEGTVDKGMIIDGSDGSVWVSSDDFTISTKEANDILNSYYYARYYRIDSVTVGEVKYLNFETDSDPNDYILAHYRTSGIVLVRTHRTIMIGHFREGTQPFRAVQAVKDLANLFRDSHY